ncbi:Schizosaccharomyces specific protein [Schizosaccharomyces osmophilus]|uniref:Schizosaccharomyces specific protein n=1 Tax=Schizosaccharomyces osmophilus TaxID=2545709 RepID=A0AAF0AYB5_9SCHI|nr:Schizosaccharomyces specific protein [Schizosaccharomyces osmophilus]WBW74855.1 Schizosaccharomyces specific protein [Schizosaccharomyces osmophilus]
MSNENEHLGNENQFLSPGKQVPPRGASRRLNRRLSVAQEDQGRLNRDFNSLTPEVDFNQEKWEDETTRPKADSPFNFGQSTNDKGSDATTDLNF